MALKLKYTDEHGILHINMSPSSTPKSDENRNEPKAELTDPKFDTINNRFGQYDLFGGKYDCESGDESQRKSLFRSRYNSIEEELANTPYAFTSERSLRNNNAFDITIKSRALADDASPSKDIEDDRFFNRSLNFEYENDLFGPQLDIQTSVKDDSPAFTITQLIHAQDRYFDLSSRQSTNLTDKSERSKTEVSKVKQPSKVKSLKNKFEVQSAPVSAKKDRTVKIVDRYSDVSKKDEAFKVLSREKSVLSAEISVKGVQEVELTTPTLPIVPTSKRKKEKSFAIIAEIPAASRPSSPRSLPAESRTGRISPFRGRGFREETSRHNTPKTSTNNSRASSPHRRRTSSLPGLDDMATTAALPPTFNTLSRPHSPRNFVKENIKEVRDLSEINREKHEAEAEEKRREEEEALLREMGLLDKNAKLNGSVVGSRTASRSNSPNKLRLRSRSNSPSAILHFENIAAGSQEFINVEDGMRPVPHRSRIRSVTRSQPESKDGSPKHSKIPKRQNSVSPNRSNMRDGSTSKKVENNLSRNQRFISNSTSSIHDVRIGNVIGDKKGMSKITQHLNIAPSNVKSKPPISPGRVGPPPSNKSINAKRLSPIVGTPNKSPVANKPGSAKITPRPTPPTKKPVQTVGNTPATSRLNSRQPSRSVSRDPSPEKRRNIVVKTTITSKTPPTKPVSRTSSTRSTNQKPTVPSKTEVKKPMSRTNSVKSLTKTPSMKSLIEKPPLNKKESNKNLKEKVPSMTKINEVGKKTDSSINDKKEAEEKLNDDKNTAVVDKGKAAEESKKPKTASAESGNSEEVTTQDNETQYDKITNDKGELVIMTKKNIVSMTTAAITSQPLEVVTTVTNQLPAAFEKAREKGVFERHSSKDSLGAKDNIKPIDDKADNSKTFKNIAKTSTIFSDDNVKLKPLQPPYNNPQVERARQKIDDILKAPEVSTENILATANAEVKETKSSFRNLADKTKNDIKDSKDATRNKFTELKDEALKQSNKAAEDIRTEASKIVDSIITPVEEPKELKEKPKEDIKTNIEPIVMVVNEKKTNGPNKPEVIERVTERLVKGDPDVEVQSSNMSTPNTKTEKMKKSTDGSESEKSQSNGGFPQSTSTTPKPPARAHRTAQAAKEDDKKNIEPKDSKETTPDSQMPGKKPNICQRLMGKCKKSKCCTCCVKPQTDDDDVDDKKSTKEDVKETKVQITENEGKEGKKEGFMSKWSCCKHKDKVEEEQRVREIEAAAGKTSIDYETEMPEHRRKRKLRDIICCRHQRVADLSQDLGDVRRMGDVGLDPAVVPSDDVVETGCCGRKKRVVERRDSILSDRQPNTCCNNRFFNWMRGACRRRSEPPTSRRPSMFSKNKSLSPTLPPESTAGHT